jgi:hypothetical protein
MRAFQGFLALVGCAMNRPATTGKLERWARCAAETPHTFSEVIGTVMKNPPSNGLGSHESPFALP